VPQSHTTVTTATCLQCIYQHQLLCHDLRRVGALSNDTSVCLSVCHMHTHTVWLNGRPYIIWLASVSQCVWSVCLWILCQQEDIDWLSAISSQIKSHTRTVVRQCCKDDCESLWKSLKFDPSPRKNGLAEFASVITSCISPPVQNFVQIRPGVFFSPYGWNITPEMFVSGGSSCRPQPRPLTDLHAKYVKRRGSVCLSGKDVPFGGFEHKI